MGGGYGCSASILRHDHAEADVQNAMTQVADQEGYHTEWLAMRSVGSSTDAPAAAAQPLLAKQMLLAQELMHQWHEKDLWEIRSQGQERLLAFSNQANALRSLCAAVRAESPRPHQQQARSDRQTKATDSAASSARAVSVNVADSAALRDAVPTVKHIRGIICHQQNLIHETIRERERLQAHLQ